MFSLLQPSELPACALRSSLLVCEYKGSENILFLQDLYHLENTYMNLYELK